jgi:hypothetical protein
VFDGDPILATPVRRRRQPKNRIAWGQNPDYETPLIEEIRSEANLARKIHQDMKRQRTKLPSLFAVCVYTVTTRKPFVSETQNWHLQGELLGTQRQSK